MVRLSAIAALVAPAAAANSWQITASNVATEITGVTFNSDAKTGYVAGGANGVGAEVLKSTDGGNTWGSTSDAFDLLPLDVTSYGNYVVASGALITLTSTDGGNTFVDADCDACVGQCVRPIGPQSNPIGIGLAGNFGSLFSEANGVAVSYNGGLNFTGYFNITNLITDARYAAFPTANTWYVTAGQWPGEGSDDQSDQTTSGSTSSSGSTTGAATGSSRASAVRSHRLTERLSVYKDENGQVHHGFHSSARKGRAVGSRALQNTTGYVAQIAKTTDAGKTWTIQYTSLNQFYFNGIDCENETSCCAAAEADDGTAAGAYIYCTFDGQTWKQTYAQRNYTGASLLDLRTVGNGGYWAVGGIIEDFPEAAGFLYSGDAGRTWTVDSTIPSQYATSVDCSVNTQDCWATLIDAEQQGSVASNVNAQKN